ncbi:MAG: hypothetical protein KAY37_17615 [Phycisphaerae bacterium]|nr:hypothetical protein [Phycisphaerae bacterium]
MTVLLVFLAGCPPCPGVAPASRREALLRVNENLTKIDQPLHCKALVSFRFEDADGKRRSFIGHDARLIFAQPRSLLFDVRSLAGTVAQFGSNDERYWVWIDVPEARKLWWGEWRRAEEGALRKLPIPPNELLDALVLRPLPLSLEGGLLPLLRLVEDDHRLLFVRLGIDGQPAGLREVRLDPCEPHQPLEIIDRLPDGQVVMHAVLGRYRRIGAEGPFTPRHYVINWPLNKAEIRLDILGTRFRPDLPGEVFDFPSEWQGESEKVVP